MMCINTYCNMKRVCVEYPSWHIFSQQSSLVTEIPFSLLPFSFVFLLTRIIFTHTYLYRHTPPSYPPVFVSWDHAFHPHTPQVPLGGWRFVRVDTDWWWSYWTRPSSGDSMCSHVSSWGNNARAQVFNNTCARRPSSDVAVRNHRGMISHCQRKTTMTSGQDVSEYLDTLDLVKSYFSSFLRKKKSKKKCLGAPTPQRIRRCACLQDCLVTLTCHLAYDSEDIK